MHHHFLVWLVQTDSQVGGGRARGNGRNLSGPLHSVLAADVLPLVRRSGAQRNAGKARFRQRGSRVRGDAIHAVQVIRLRRPVRDDVRDRAHPLIFRGVFTHPDASVFVRLEPLGKLSRGEQNGIMMTAVMEAG